MRIKLFFILWLLLSDMAYSNIDKKQQKEINFLISHVNNSECIFNRNGIDYKGSEAVTHIIRKYDYYKNKIKTTEDFIELAATKSEISGRHYTVKCKNSEIQELGKWLLKALSTLRKKAHTYNKMLHRLTIPMSSITDDKLKHKYHTSQ
jgi:hypothetical protein